MEQQKLDEGPATVAEILPHDEVPSLPNDDGPVPVNDPIEPELEQTPAWRYEKTAHMATLVDRQLERLDQALAAAESAGDPDELRRLRIKRDRQRERLASIRSRAEALRAEAEAEGLEVSAAP